MEEQEKKELTQLEYDNRMNELYAQESEEVSKHVVANKQLQLKMDELNVKMKELELERQITVIEKRKTEDKIQEIRADFRRMRRSYKVINDKTIE